MWPFTSRKKTKPASRRTHAVKLQARYDAAQTTAENRRHWVHADGLSADAAASADVRKTLRERARYEFANNSYCNGIVKTLADFCVGTGPRLQLLTEDGELNALVEQVFRDWADEIDLAGKLATMRITKAVDGEAFAVLAYNETLTSPIKLDIELVEADRVCTPWARLGVGLTGDEVDGIKLDAAGRPESYWISRRHPGDAAYGYSADEWSKVPAERVIHWFRADRPGQHRGVPEITPALPLFAQLRRYTLAVLGAAETAADFAAVLYTDAPAEEGAAPIEPLDVVELEKRMATTLPDGWKLAQIKAEQPTTSYSEFKKEILNEIARCLNLPYNIAACNSAGYNYASGRLDHQTFFKSVRIEQASLSRCGLSRIMDFWIRHARTLPEFARLRGAELRHQWFFDGTEHVDPSKEATAQDKRLKNNTTNLAAEYAKEGKDWEVELRQRAKEKALLQELGLTEKEAAPKADKDKTTEPKTPKEAKRDAATRNAA